jgi:C1A family cysteine protease
LARVGLPYQPGKYAERPPAAVEQAQRFRIAEASPVSSISDLKRALVQNGPAVAGIALYTSATSGDVSKTGVIPLPKEKEQMVGGHAIVIVGYDDQASRVKFVNSWGSNWGEEGFGYLPYAYIAKYMTDAWTFTI